MGFGAGIRRMCRYPHHPRRPATLTVTTARNGCTVSTASPSTGRRRIVVIDPPRAIVALAECNRARNDARIQIDLILLTLLGREMYSSTEVMNMLLDVRRTLL